jgi:hypothetical protein
MLTILSAPVREHRLLLPSGARRKVYRGQRRRKVTIHHSGYMRNISERLRKLGLRILTHFFTRKFASVLANFPYVVSFTR